jgi:hypothetical protein
MECAGVRIDPVVALMDELGLAYASLAEARDSKDWDATRRELAAIACLHSRLRETEPSTVIGAAHLLREAAALLLRSSSPYYGDCLRAVADRLEEGRRLFSDLIWLRNVRRTLAAGNNGRQGENAAELLALALKGAARPVLLYRNVAPPVRQGAPIANETRV